MRGGSSIVPDWRFAWRCESVGALQLVDLAVCTTFQATWAFEKLFNVSVMQESGDVVVEQKTLLDFTSMFLSTGGRTCACQQCQAASAKHGATALTDSTSID